jgi:hypothetical protein
MAAPRLETLQTRFFVARWRVERVSRMALRGMRRAAPGAASPRGAGPVVLVQHGHGTVGASSRVGTWKKAWPTSSGSWWQRRR